MKIPNYRFSFLLLIVLLSSCVTTSYMGDRLAPTNQIDVYYAAKDVKKEYKVIGHIATAVALGEEASKQRIITKAKSVGADGVIILGMDYTGGEDSGPYSKAEAIQYTKE